MSEADSLIEWLERGPGSQRDKVAALPQHVAAIRALHDDDFTRVVRAIKKQLNSPKLAASREAVIAALAIDRAPNPRPAAPVEDAPPLAQPAIAVDDSGVALEAALVADPDDRQAAAVYGDWLEAKGDPRGRLVAIGNELAKSPGDKALLREHDVHLAGHPAILGMLASCDDIVTDVAWSRGFIRKCRVSYTMERFNLERPKVDVADVIGWLLDDPGPARFLQDLTVGVVVHDDNDYTRVAAAIAKRPRALRRLYLGDFTSDEIELNWSRIGDVSAMWPALARLRELTLRSGSMTLGAIDLPRLRQLTTITGGMSGDALASIANARWPALEELALQIGVGHQGAASDPALVAPILAGDNFPALTELGLTNCELTDELCELLPGAPILPRIRALDLSMGTMTDAGAAILAERVRGLDRLDVSENYLSQAMRARLAPCAAKVEFGVQRTARNGHRHAAAYE